MINYITYIKDSLNQNYLGIKFPIAILRPFLDDLEEILGEDYEEFVQNQKNRDRDSHHLTVINVRDYNSLSKYMTPTKFVESLQNILKYEIDDLKMMGIGTAEKSHNRTYFIVCKSEKLDAVRKVYDLPPHDFHITLGFKDRDVFGVRKNEVMERDSKFIKLLSNEYYKNESWSFIRDIENFKLSREIEILPISIKDTTAKFKVGDEYIEISYLEDIDKMWIVCKYPSNKEEYIITDDELVKILKK